MRKISLLLTSLVTFSLIAGTALAAVNAVTPSTNDINRTNGWAHVDQLSADIGSTEVEFNQPRSFIACFEYRSDGDDSQKIADDNFNPAITDGLYPYTCVDNSTASMTLTANEYVEIRMVFGAEGDERFDWTRFDVLPDATSQADCVSDGYEAFGFENQGQCIRFVNTGKDDR